LEAKAIVTGPVQTFKIAGQTVHQVGIPGITGGSHGGWRRQREPAHPTIGDANTMIPESKAFLVNVEKKGGK